MAPATTHQPAWGSVGQDLLRTAPAQYADGVSALGGANRPSPRLISDVLVTDATDGGLPNSRFMSDWVYAWGQFIDHDLDLTTGGTGSRRRRPTSLFPRATRISIPTEPARRSSLQPLRVRPQHRHQQSAPAEKRHHGLARRFDGLRLQPDRRGRLVLTRAAA